MLNMNQQNYKADVSWLFGCGVDSVTVYAEHQAVLLDPTVDDDHHDEGNDEEK